MSFKCAGSCFYQVVKSKYVFAERTREKTQCCSGERYGLVVVLSILSPCTCLLRNSMFLMLFFNVLVNKILVLVHAILAVVSNSPHNQM